MADDLLPPGSSQVGRYELVRKLATGGMAEVFLARAAGPGGFEKTLVIKRILPQLAEDPDFVQMFLHEARVAAQFNHPNVVQMFDFGEADGSYFLAMEFVDGPNLRSLLRAVPNRQIPLTIGARIVASACEGLAYAHEFLDPATGARMGLVHRDVSSDNLLVGRNGVVKVVDFGVAKVAGQISNTAAGTVKGKIAYMPPEQILGGSDLRADVYALGVILYELAAGARPYDQLPDVQMIAAVLRTDPVPLLTRAPYLPVAWAKIVEKAMARNVDARYQDCHALGAALEDFIAASGERVGAVQVAQYLGSALGSPSTSSRNLRAVPGTSPGSGSSPGSGATPASGPTPASSSYRGAPVHQSGGDDGYRGSLSVMGLAGGDGAYQGSGSVIATPTNQSGRFSGVGSDPSTPWADLPPPFLSSPSPVPMAETTGVLKGRVGEPVTPEARAYAVLADVEALRIYEAGSPLFSAAEQASVREELEREDVLSLLSRFPTHTARLVQANPDAPRVLAERIVGCVEGLLLAESYARLGYLFERLAAGATRDDNLRWVYETARAALARPEQVTRIAERLREGRPPGAGLPQVMRAFGGEFAPLWIGVAESPELAFNRETLLLGLAELAGLNPEPFLERVLEENPRRLADFVFVLEKGRVADRQRVFRQVLGRRDSAQRVEVITGLARAGTDEGCNLLTQALGERVEAVRLQAIELLGQYFPERVYRLLEPALKAEVYQGRSPAERAALWRAVGCSTLPDGLAVIGEVLRQKPSLLTKSKVEALKLEALEGVATMKSAQALRFLTALSEDGSQPDAVVAAVRRLLARGWTAFEAPRVVPEVRRWDRVDCSARALLLDLFSLSHAARLVDAHSPVLETAFTRARVRLDALLRVEHKVMVRLTGPQVSVFGAKSQSAHEGDPEIARVAGAFAARGVSSFTFSGAPVSVEELQHLVRWLAEGAGAEGVSTPHIQRELQSGASDLPGRPVVPAPLMPDPSREAMVRYVDLIFELRGFLADKRTQPALQPPESRVTIEEISWVMETRRVRFLGLTPWSIGRDAVAFHHANVLVLALGFAAELGFSRDRLGALAEFAAFHDVGMYELSEETLQRPGDLTPSDKRALLEARIRSAWFPFLRRQDSPRAAEWVCVVAEHGLDWGKKDEAGLLKQRTEVGLLGSIVSLSKVYDALTSRRSYRPAMTPPAALEALTRKAGHRFRPDVLQLFVRFVRRQSVRIQPRR